MNDFVWEETPWEQALPDFCDPLPAATFLALLEGEEEDTVEQALADLQQRDILLDVENLSFEGSGAKMQARLLQEKGLAEGSVKLRDFDENDPLRLFLLELDGMPEAEIPAVTPEGVTDTQREALANAYLPAVAKLALSYAGKGVLLMDLIQEGSLGLWQGIAAWERGNLQTYLDRCIRRAMAAAITLQARQNGVGARIRKAMEDYRWAERTLLSQIGRNPGVSEIAEYLNITEDAAGEVYKMLQNAAAQSQSPEAEETEESEPDEENAVEATAYYQMRQRISDLLESLEPLDAKILTLRFGLETGTPMEDAAIAEKLGIAASQVLERAAKALETLRNQ